MTSNKQESSKEDDKSSAVTSSSLQSALLRLCLICASSQSTIREEMPLRILPYNSSPCNLPDDSLCSQIRNDVLSLLNLIQKHSNALTLALKPKNGTSSNSSLSSQSLSKDSISPTSELDSESLKAASSQLNSLLSDVTPKLVFLVLTALKSRAVYQSSLPPTTSETESEQDRQREQLRIEVEKMGGTLMSGEQLGLESNGNGPKKSEIPSPKQARRIGGIGITWSNQLKLIIEEVLENLATLAESFMDARTLNAVEMAENSRARKMKSANVTDGSPREISKRAPKSIKEARQSALEKTKALDNLCKSIKEENRIKTDNREACRELWSRNSEILQDGEMELFQALKDLETDEGFEGDDIPGLTMSLLSLEDEIKRVSVPDEKKSNGEGDGIRVDKTVEDSFYRSFEIPSKERKEAQPGDKPVELKDSNIQDLLPKDPKRRRAVEISPIIRIGKMLHEKIRLVCFSPNGSGTTDSKTSTPKPLPQLDLDLLSQLSTSLVDAQDDLISTILYDDEDGDDLFGLDYDEEEEEEEEDDEDEEERLRKREESKTKEFDSIKQSWRKYVEVSKQLSEAASTLHLENQTEQESLRDYFGFCRNEIERVARKAGYLD